MNGHKDIVIKAIEAMRLAERPEKLTDSITVESIREANFWDQVDEVCKNLNWVKDGMSGDSICGLGASITTQWLKKYFSENDINGQVMSATSSVDNGTFHHYNVVQIDHGEPLIVDLTASQFFYYKFMDVFDRPYFVGTRQELKEIVQDLQRRGLEFARHNFPDMDFPSGWHLDYHIWNNWDFKVAFNNGLKGDENPQVDLESYFYGWEITWGDQSLGLYKGTGKGLKEDFDQAVQSMDCVVQKPTAAIPDLINYLSGSKLTLNDAPEI